MSVKHCDGEIKWTMNVSGQLDYISAQVKDLICYSKNGMAAAESVRGVVRFSMDLNVPGCP